MKIKLIQRKSIITNLVLFTILFINVLSIPIGVKAKEDVGIEEGQEYTWELTKVDEDTYPQYKEGDQYQIKIEILEYRENNDVYLIYAAFKGWDDEEDDPYQTNYFEIYEDPTDDDAYLSSSSPSFITNEDIEDYLEEFADNHTNYEAKDNKITYNTTLNYRSWEFNDDGIVSEYTRKYNDSTTMSYELIESGGGIISFGYEFLYFIPVGIIGCIIIIQRKGGLKKHEHK